MTFNVHIFMIFEETYQSFCEEFTNSIFVLASQIIFLREIRINLKVNILSTDQFGNFRPESLRFKSKIRNCDIKFRYKQTVHGVAWALLQPLATMVVLDLFFGRLAGVPTDG